MGTINVLLYEEQVIYVTGFSLRLLHDIIKLEFSDLEYIIIQTWCGGRKVATHYYDGHTKKYKEIL